MGRDVESAPARVAIGKAACVMPGHHLAAGKQDMRRWRRSRQSRACWAGGLRGEGPGAPGRCKMSSRLLGVGETATMPWVTELDRLATDSWQSNDVERE